MMPLPVHTKPTTPVITCISSSGIGSPPSQTEILTATPVDPTRLRYYWEQAHALDYATLGAIDVLAAADLDAETPSAGIQVSTSPTA